MDMRKLIDKSCTVKTIHAKEIKQRGGHMLVCKTLLVTDKDGNEYTLIIASEDKKAVVVC